MIDNYKVKIDNNEEVLFLYINYNYEFGNFDNKKSSILKTIRDYLKEHRINFNGNKIKLVVSGIVLCTLILNRSDLINKKNYNNNLGYSYVSSIIFDSDYKLEQKSNEETVEEQKIENNNIEINNVVEDVKQEEENINNKTPSINNEVVSNKNNVVNIENNISNETLEKVITLYRTNGEILQINMNDYLVGVVAAEMPASFNIEALKTQAIISRTYTLKLIEQNKQITDNSSTQNYKDIQQLKVYWGKDFDKYYNKIKTAVSETNNLVITYKNRLIDAVFHSTSNGYTEDAINVWGYDIPYLKQVNSEFDIYTTPYYREISFSYEHVSNILGINVSADTNIVIYKNDSNRVSVIYLDGIAFSGVNFRNLLGLRSADFDIIKNESSITIATRGYGHGVGISQYGSNYLATIGYNYEQIIKYYYQNVEIVSNKNF